MGVDLSAWILDAAEALDRIATADILARRGPRRRARRLRRKSDLDDASQIDCGKSARGV